MYYDYGIVKCDQYMHDEEKKTHYVIARSRDTCLVVGGCVPSSLVIIKLGELQLSKSLNARFSPT